MEAELEGLVKTHSYAKSVEESQFNKASFLSFDRMVWLEGGSQNPKNVEAVVEICKECLKRGSDYWERNDFSKRVKYAYQINGFQSKTKETWEDKTEGNVTGDAGSKAKVDKVKPAGGEPVVEGGGKPLKPHRERTKLELSLAGAVSAKSDFSGVELKATRLIAKLDKDPAYIREKNAFHGDLQTLIAEAYTLRDSDDFFKDFILKDVSDVKRLYNEDTMSSKCSQFQDKFRVPIKALSVKVKEVQAMVRTREQAQAELAAGDKKKAVATPKKKAGRTK